MATSRIAATDERIMSLQDVLNSILSVSSVRIPMRKLASVCGKIISLTFAIINSASSWNSHVHLSSESLTDLTFWRYNVASLNSTLFA